VSSGLNRHFQVPKCPSEASLSLPSAVCLFPSVAPAFSSVPPGLQSELQCRHKNGGTVIAVAMTSQPQRAGFPLTMELADSKLPKKSWAKMSQVRTLSVKRIGKKSEEQLKKKWHLLLMV